MSALDFFVQIGMVSIILNCFSIGTQVSSGWNAFCCRKPSRITLANLKCQFLVIRKNIATDQFYNFHQGAFLEFKIPISWFRYHDKFLFT